jgi:hypothetical protein
MGKNRKLQVNETDISVMLKDDFEFTQQPVALLRLAVPEISDLNCHKLVDRHRN